MKPAKTTGSTGGVIPAAFGISMLPDGVGADMGRDMVLQQPVCRRIVLQDILYDGGRPGAGK